MKEVKLQIQNKLGLHARPAALFVKTAAKFKSDVFISRDSQMVNGKSIMGVMMLAAEMGAELVITANGEDEDAVQKRREALQKRHEVLARNLPHSKFRRWFRMSAGVLLMTLFLGLFLFRDGLVWAFPQLAGLYEGVGIEVNVIGIEFKSVNTVRALRDGVETLMIKADLVNVSSRQVNVPRVRVELIGADGNLLYEWNATPQARVLRPSESVEFSAQLASPPLDAVDMRLGFVENQGEAAIP